MPINYFPMPKTGNFINFAWFRKKKCKYFLIVFVDIKYLINFKLSSKSAKRRIKNKSMCIGCCERI